MIVFKKIKYKNFLATGAAFVEIKLNENPTTLMVGANGSGKSSILDALTFVLFGKAFRNINKPALVNSINQNKCEVYIEFEVNGKEYLVKRGIKPTIFEIYCDGTLLNQDSASKDYQAYLEKHILGMNFKSFTQIVILGSASYTSFMKLRAQDRCEVTEDMLDISVFSTMNVLVKERLQANKENIEKNKLTLIGKEEKKKYIEENIKSLKTNNKEKIAQINKTIDDEDDQKIIKTSSIVILQKEYKELSAQYKNGKLKEKHNKLLIFHSKIETNIDKLNHDIGFFDGHDNCPVCRQGIEHDHKEKILTTLTGKREKYLSGMGDINYEIGLCVEEISKQNIIQTRMNAINNEIHSIQSEIRYIDTHREDLEDEISNIENSDKILLSNVQELKTVNQEVLVLTDEREQLLLDKLFLETAIQLLKEGGIKSKIIKQYLPIMNKLINKNLSKLGFAVNFEINEKFEETIKSRYRDIFAYENFSEGEKTRIDLAILFMWRSLARMKNNVNTNLLILDEIFDGSLDGNGTDSFIDIIQEMADSNIIIISHKVGQLLDKFGRVIHFEKKGNYSKVKK